MEKRVIFNTIIKWQKTRVEPSLGVEPKTLPLLRACSNQLSYEGGGGGPAGKIVLYKFSEKNWFRTQKIYY